MVSYVQKWTSGQLGLWRPQVPRKPGKNGNVHAKVCEVTLVTVTIFSFGFVESVRDFVYIHKYLTCKKTLPAFITHLMKCT
jgi:hypothetical protein